MSVARSEQRGASANEETGRAASIWAVMRALQSLRRHPQTSVLSGLILITAKLSKSNVLQEEAEAMLRAFCVFSVKIGVVVGFL